MTQECDMPVSFLFELVLSCTLIRVASGILTATKPWWILWNNTAIQIRMIITN